MCDRTNCRPCRISQIFSYSFRIHACGKQGTDNLKTELTCNIIATNNR